MTDNNIAPKADKPNSGRKPLSQFLFAPNSEIPRPKRDHSSAPEPILIVETDSQRLHFAESNSPQTAYPAPFHANPVQRIDYPLYDTASEPEANELPALPKPSILPILATNPVKTVVEKAQADEIVPGAPFPLDDSFDSRPTLFRRYLSILREKQARQRLARQPIPAISVSSGQSSPNQSGATCQHGQFDENTQSSCDEALFSSLSPEAQDSFRQFLRSLG